MQNGCLACHKTDDYCINLCNYDVKTITELEFSDESMLCFKILPLIQRSFKL